MNGMIETKLKRMGLALAALAGGLIGSGMAAHAQDKVGFATNWKAQGSQGGFYQAIADGTYKKYGLDVEIVQGGPQVNTRALLPAGKVDFLLSPSPQNALENNRAKIPTMIVAAFFQKDPQALMAHPGRYKELGDMKAAPMVFIGKPAQFTWWPWLKLKFGFSDDQVKPYNYTLAPFLTKPDSVQQAYATAEALYVDTFNPTYSCWPTTAGLPTRTSSRRAVNSSRTTRTWCSASSMPRSLDGTTTSTATASKPMP